jgi:flavin-dependent dehydrogenase
MADQNDFDVLICGGGLAGLTLARQLKLELPGISIAVIDRLARPLPEAAFKVGESSIELSTYYFGQVLKLAEYFKRCQLFKLGLRFFFGEAHGPLDDRPETGPDMFSPVPSYQIDRGRLENDLRQMAVEMRIVIYEGSIVEEILLADGEEKHIVKCRVVDGQASFSLAGRWVVDALGRRRFLQTKLGLKKTNGHQASAAWWRYAGRIDVDDIGGNGGHKWRKLPIESRYFSTNHLMGKGYWVWLIPLASGATSVGIVTDETIHPQRSYGQSYTQALEWLHTNEPILWEFIRNQQPLDFHSLKNYSYASEQIFSSQRWSCVGEAGVFLDPLYSLGSDFIAIGNTITVEMIRRDRAGGLTEEAIETFNRLVLELLFPLCLDYYRGTYRTFGHAQIFTAKLAWDTAINWAWMTQLFIQGLIQQPVAEILLVGEKYRSLNESVQQLFIDWAEKAPPLAIFVRGDMTRMRFWQLLHLELMTRRSHEQVLEIARKNLIHFEELAQVLFWQAVEECYPEHSVLQQRPWVNAWRMRLDPDKWSEEGLFEPESLARPLRQMRDNFTGIFAPQSLREILMYELPYQMLHWGKGFVYYKLVPILHRLVFVNKPAMWARKFMIKDYPFQTDIE